MDKYTFVSIAVDKQEKYDLWYSKLSSKYFKF